MKIQILDDNGTKRSYDVSTLKEVKEEITYVDASSKETSILKILSAYKSGRKQVLYDKKNKALNELLQTLDLEKKEFSMLLFSSGTTGMPVGAFKSKKNLDLEMEEQIALLKKYNPKKIVSTVPFIHIYGILAAVLLPYKLDIDLFFKEHFLPYDLLLNIEPNTVVVTTPLYIKALLQLEETRDLQDVVFISSTAPLEKSDAKKFIEKFNTNLYQLFGSTETGGIAYKEQAEEFWTPIPSVEVSADEEGLLKIKSPFTSKLVYENGFRDTLGIIRSCDYVEFKEKKFKIIGRNTQIFKVGGKRYSTLHVEEILESLKGVQRAYVRVIYRKNELKDEVLDVYLQTREKVYLKQIQKLLREEIGNIKFPIVLKIVEEIPTTGVGKKIMPL
jgi:acyl-coenzyme A synthetase/AMP-(fatty) acid ligase